MDTSIEDQGEDPSGRRTPESPSGLLLGRDGLVSDVLEHRALNHRLLRTVTALLVFSAVYGVVAGSYSGGLQAVSASVKMPLLFLGTLFVCFPAFFVIQLLLGSRLSLMQVSVLVLHALALTTVLLAAFVPVIVFFLITGADYYFLQLLHVVVIVICGGLGMRALHENLSLVYERHGDYPPQAMAVMKVWIVLFAFVGVQLAWNLRPFVGDRGEPFRLFRDYEGNFYSALIYSAGELIRSEGAGIAPRAQSPEAAEPVGIGDLLRGIQPSDAPDSVN